MLHNGNVFAAATLDLPPPDAVHKQRPQLPAGWFVSFAVLCVSPAVRLACELDAKIPWVRLTPRPARPPEYVGAAAVHSFRGDSRPGVVEGTSSSSRWVRHATLQITQHPEDSLQSIDAVRCFAWSLQRMGAARIPLSGLNFSHAMAVCTLLRVPPAHL